MADIGINPGALAMVGDVRPRAGAKPGLDGKIAEEDMEVVISFQMGCLRIGSIVGADGKHHGQMVQVGEVCRPFLDFTRNAEQLLGLRERKDEAAESALLVRQ